MLPLAIAPTRPNASSVTPCRHIVVVLGAVILVHAGLLAWMVAVRDRTIERPLESRTITAELLSPEPQPVVPLAVLQPPPPHPVPPAAHAKPLARTRPMASPAPLARAPRAESAAPSPVAPSAPVLNVPAPAAPAASATATATATAIATATASAIERPTLALSAPKNVSHVDCNIAKPDYPDPSKRRGENGTAIVRFVVGLSGRIEDIQLQKSSGYPRLDDAALGAIHASECQPYTENGEAIRAAYSQLFVFALPD
jgi:protein TonB